MRFTLPMTTILLLLTGCALGQFSHSNAYEKGAVVGRIKAEDVRESSGVAIGHANPDHLWTHNDSGDSPRLFLLARNGTHVATYTVTGADAHDWEDMCSFVLDGKPWLLVGDTGDNARKQPFRTLYLIEEPRFNANTKHPHELARKPAMRMDVMYPDRPRDCESVAFDPTTRTILLVSKEPSGGPVLSPGPAEVFAVVLPDQPTTKALMVERIGVLAGVQATSADVSPDGRRLVISTVGDAVLVERAAEQHWADALRISPTRVTVPLRLQGESICFDTDGRSLLLTSERANQPIWRVPARD